jgi:hypothetical protein
MWHVWGIRGIPFAVETGVRGRSRLEWEDNTEVNITAAKRTGLIWLRIGSNSGLL